MPKDARSHKKDLKHLKKEKKSPGVKKPHVNSKNTDGRRSRKKKRSSENQESLSSIRTTLFSLHNNIINKNKNTPIEKQEFCSRMGILYSNMLELAFEAGTSEEDTEMEWQHEPTTLVRLVRTSEELASYPDGAVVWPWQTGSNSNSPSASSNNLVRQRPQVIEDVL
ncbi:hypothetical protein FSPOR_7949 [Fusarium sporotrichioides]|uniref:Uncharacterized protein n=1 Tax=Fusarium sporotrichioides TaxID=5514 RepID=A0A395RX77_FUSSP|nr:hypothetical protein FSPOR_7949 [Fusarium sporotrichioides]